MSEMSQRLDRLEREVRMFRVAGALTLLGLATVVLTAQAAPPAEKVEARQVVIVDGEGKARGRWSVDEEGYVALELLDGAGKPRAVLSADPEITSGLALLDEAGRDRAVLGLDNHGPRLRMAGPDEADAVSLGVGTETGSERADSVLLELAVGGVGVVAGGARDAPGFFSVLGPDGQMVEVLAGGETGAGVLVKKGDETLFETRGD